MNDRAFNLIFKEHNRMVTAYLHSLLSDWHEAVELTQETFIVAHRKMDEFEDGRSLAAWLRGIAMNLARNALRKRRQRAVLLENDGIENIYLSLDEAESNEKWENRLTILDNCVERLPERQRQSIELHYTQAEPASRIAQVLGVKVQTVFQMLWHAREALRQCIAQALAEKGVKE